MKTIPALFCAGMLMSALCAGFVACNELNGDEQRRIEMAKLTDDVYYVVGNDAQSVIVQDDGTVKAGVYLFISDNLQDTVSVYNYTEDWLPDKLLDGVFEFPADVIRQGGICGFALFPKEYRYSYPVKINSHRPMTATEEMATGNVCNAMIPYSPIKPNKSIFVESLSKIE